MFSLKRPTFFSGLGSVAFHLVFIVYSGYYIMSQDRVEPLQKKVFKLEVVKKKEPPPVEKKQIREIVKQVNKDQCQKHLLIDEFDCSYRLYCSYRCTSSRGK